MMLFAENPALAHFLVGRRHGRHGHRPVDALASYPSYQKGYRQGRALRAAETVFSWVGIVTLLVIALVSVAVAA